MQHERLLRLTLAAPSEKLLDLGRRCIARNDTLLYGGDGLPDDDAQRPDPRITSEQRRYLIAFDRWLHDPTRENLQIRRAAYLAMVIVLRA